jgi:hypothetical protein
MDYLPDGTYINWTDKDGNDYSGIIAHLVKAGARIPLWYCDNAGAGRETTTTVIVARHADRYIVDCGISNGLLRYRIVSCSNHSIKKRNGTY